MRSSLTQLASAATTNNRKRRDLERWRKTACALCTR